MLFSTVSSAFCNIESLSSRTAITQELARLLTLCESEEAALVVNLALGQLHPPYANKQFNVAEKTVLKAIALVLSIELQEVQKAFKEVGDIGALFESYQWKGACQLTIQEVADRLYVLEDVQGEGAVEEKIECMKALFALLDGLSAKFVARIIVGKLRLGFSDMTILDALSIMVVGDKSIRSLIEHAYNVCVDIGKITYELKMGGVDLLKEQKVAIGIPIMPAAAERLATAQAIIEKIGPCVAQPKLDGFRVQIHVDKTNGKKEVHFFSRNLKDMSDMFPDLVSSVLQLPAEQYIMEGEAIVYDIHTGAFLPFQETVKRKRKHDIETVAQEYPLKLFLFDLLYLDGQEQFSYTHAERRATLSTLCQTQENDCLAVIKEKEIADAHALETYFHEVISDGLEGLVVKKKDARYRPGKRDFNWIKLKRQEEGHLDDTLDCVILGYYRGKGRRSSFGIGALLVGIYNKEQDCFQTIAKIGTGFSDQELLDIKEKATSCIVPEQPHTVICAHTLVPDVWLYPEIVCMIRADEITISPVHTAGKTDTMLGYALRFPRFMGYREDKSAKDATTVQEVVQLFHNQSTRKNSAI